MRLIHETESQLLLKQSGIGTIISGLVFVLMGSLAIIVANQNIAAARVIGGIFVISGMFIILTAKFITFTVNKVQNRLDYAAKSLFGNTTRNIDFTQIKELSFEEYSSTKSSSSGRSTQTSDILVFYLKDGEGFSVPFGGTSGGVSIMGIPLGGLMSKRNKSLVLANKIAAFIGVPCMDRRPPTTVDMLKAVTEGIATGIATRKTLNEHHIEQDATSSQPSPKIPPVPDSNNPQEQ